MRGLENPSIDELRAWRNIERERFLPLDLFEVVHLEQIFLKYNLRSILHDFVPLNVNSKVSFFSIKD